MTEPQNKFTWLKLESVTGLVSFSARIFLDDYLISISNSIRSLSTALPINFEVAFKQHFQADVLSYKCLLSSSYWQFILKNAKNPIGQGEKPTKKVILNKISNRTFFFKLSYLYKNQIFYISKVHLLLKYFHQTCTITS